MNYMPQRWGLFVYLSTKNREGFWRRPHEGGFLVYKIVQLSLAPLAVLKDWSVTWGMKNTLPLAAVENIGQLTRVGTRVLREWKVGIEANREGYGSCKVRAQIKNMM